MRTAGTRGQLEEGAAGLRQAGEVATEQALAERRRATEGARQFDVTTAAEAERTRLDDAARLRDQMLKFTALTEDIAQKRTTLQETIRSGRWKEYMDTIGSILNQAVQREGLDLQSRQQVIDYARVVKAVDQQTQELANRRAEQQALMSAAEKAAEAESDANWMGLVAELIKVGAAVAVGVGTGNPGAGIATYKGLDAAQDVWEA